MTASQVLALSGRDLDRAVHKALWLKGRAPAYSTSDAVAVSIISALPVGVAKIKSDSPGYTPQRPFVAFVVKRDDKTPVWSSTMSVTSATISMALCKLVLLTFAEPDGAARPVIDTPMPEIGTVIASTPMEKQPKRLTKPLLPVLEKPNAI